MNYTYFKARNLFVLLVVASSLLQISCKKENTLATPQITKIRAITPDSVITAAFPGQLVVIQGSHLGSAMAISFYGFPASFNSGIFSDSNLVVRVPSIKWDSIPSGKANTVEVMTPAGTATYKFNINAPAPIITSVSNENATPGTTIIISGTDFYGVTQVTFPGGIPGTNLQTTGTTQITVTVPSGITSGDSLRVTGNYGTGASKFIFDNYLSPTTGFLANFEDGNPYFGWAWWGGIKTNDATLFPSNTGNYIRIHPSGSINAGDGSWYGDNRAVMIDKVTWMPAANLADPIANYQLKFEINVKTPWSNGALMIAANGNFDYLARYAPWEKSSTGSFVTNGWQTVTIPLTSFLKQSDPGKGAAPATLATLTGGTNIAPLQIMLYNDSTTPLPAFDAAVDNVRIVKLQ